MTAYYNEIEPFAAEWLRNLIAAGLIAPGDVDTRSIEAVKPDDLKSYSQCHFFAGIGVWSHALRRAGWSDDRPVWTGSCPCQPFSAAGKGGGFADERHLWPAWFHLIGECRPPIVFGEQVASKGGLGWFDLVSADLEGAGYASGAVDLCAAGVGAPHIRQRLWFVAERLADAGRPGDACLRGPGEAPGTPDAAERETQQRERGGPSSRAGSASGGLADATDAGCERRRPGEAGDGRDAAWIEPERLRDAGGAGAHHGFWRDADWLFCRDGRWRPVSPGTFPLVASASPRMGCLCAACGTETRRQGQGVLVLRRQPDRLEGCSQEDLLRQGMLPATPADRARLEQEHGALPRKEGSATEMLSSLPFDTEPARTPHRQGSNERRPDEPAGAVPSVSRAGAFGSDAEVDMCSVQNRIYRAVTQEPEQDLFCPVCKRMGSHFCEEEMGGDRVGRLRAYGNAICAEAAETFIRAYDDIRLTPEEDIFG